MMTQGKIGGLLIAAGVLLLLSILGYLPGQLFLVLLGLGFAAVYVMLGARKSYGNVGFLIPGMILLAVGLFAWVGELVDAGDLAGSIFFIWLSAAFWAVLLIHTLSFRGLSHGERWWPTYPALGLLSLAGLIAAATTWKTTLPLEAINYLWAAALLIAGLWLVFGRRRNTNKD